MATPSIRDRARLAWDVFRAGLPWDRDKSGVPLLFPSWRLSTPQWALTDYASYVDEGFSLNSLIYSAIMYKARATTAAPLRAWGGDLDHPERLPERHPLAQLMARPNPYTSGAEMQQVARVHLNIAGNCFTYLDRPKPDALPVAMYCLRPDRIRIIPDAQGIKGFLYLPEGKSINDGVPILPADMIHVKLPNPADPLEGLGMGLSPLAAIAYSGDVDNDITRFLKLFFQSGTMTSTVLKYKQKLDPNVIAKIKARWREQYGGWQNWADVGVLDNDGDLQRLGMTFEEMGFDKLDERNESRILGPFGVPPILIGTRIGLLRSTYSNYEQARRAFWEDTFVPELAMFETEYQYYLTGQDGAFVAYDLSGVPALQQSLPDQVTAAKTLWDMGVPAARAFEVVGLDVGDVDGADQGYLPMTLIPVGASQNQQPTTSTGGASATDDSRDGAKMVPFRLRPRVGAGAPVKPKMVGAARIVSSSVQHFGRRAPQ